MIKYIMANQFIVFNTGDRVQDRKNRKIGTVDNNNTLKLRKIRSLLVKFDDGSKKIYVDSEDKQLLHYPNDYFDKTIKMDERFTWRLKKIEMISIILSKEIKQNFGEIKEKNG